MTPERRASPRLRVYDPVRLYLSGSPRPVETLTKDLAVGGMRSVSTKAFPISTRLHIELMLPNGQELLSLYGRTVWFRTIPNSDQFELGIAFTEISENCKRRLSAYLDRLSSHTPSLQSISL